MVKSFESGRRGLDETATQLRGGVIWGGRTKFYVNGLMAGKRRISRSGYDRKHKESSTQRSHR